MRLSATAWRYSPASFSSRRKATTSDIILSGDGAPSDPTVGIAGCCARSERSCGRRDAADKRDDLATSHVTTPEDRALRNMKNDIILMKNDITLRRGCVRNGFAL